MNANSPLPEKEIGFWERQFRLPATWPQVAFDLIFGVIAPVFCVLVDPIVFVGEIGLFRSWCLMAYLEIAVGIVALGYYLLTRHASSLLSGVLFAGAIFSLLLGILLLPCSFWGLIIIIGLFGFTPFLTGFVFMRNGCRCLEGLSPRVTRIAARRAVTLGIILTLLVPVGLQVTASHLIKRAIVALQSDSERDFVRAVLTLKWMRFTTDTDRIILVYQMTGDEKRRQRLTGAFQTITGQTIEERQAELKSRD